MVKKLKKNEKGILPDPKNVDLGSGSVLKNIIKLALPMMIGMFSQTLFNVVDTIYLGRFSSQAIAAVSMTFPVIFLVIAFAGGIGIGVTSLISRSLGAKKIKQAGNTAEHGLFLGVIISVLISIVGVFVSRPLFKFIGASDALLTDVVSYANIIFMGSFFMFLAFMVNSILRGTGDTKTPMKIMLIATMINIVLDPLLIYGLWIFPRWGVQGAAIATVIARAFAFSYGIYYLLSGKSFLSLKLKYFRFDLNIIKAIFRVGMPASISQSFVSLGFLFMMKIVAMYGDLTVAAFGIFVRLDSVAVLPIIGISNAIMTIIGYNVGAKNYERAQKTFWLSILISLGIGTFIGIIYFLFPIKIYSIFTDDMRILLMGKEIFRIVGLFTGVSVLVIVIAAAFEGAGKAMPALLITLLRWFGFMMPFAYLTSLYLGWDRIGIWWAFPFSGLLATIIGLLWFNLGSWKKDTVTVVKS